MKESLVTLCVSSLVTLLLMGMVYLFKTESVETAVTCVLMTIASFSGIGVLVLNETETLKKKENDNKTE